MSDSDSGAARSLEEYLEARRNAADIVQRCASVLALQDRPVLTVVLRVLAAPRAVLPRALDAWLIDHAAGLVRIQHSDREPDIEHRFRDRMKQTFVEECDRQVRASASLPASRAYLSTRRAAWEIVMHRPDLLEESVAGRLGAMWVRLTALGETLDATDDELLLDLAQRLEPASVNNAIASAGRVDGLVDPQDALCHFLASARRWADQHGIDFGDALAGSYESYAQLRYPSSEAATDPHVRPRGG